MYQDVLGALRAGDAAAAVSAATRWAEAEPASADALLWLAQAQAAGKELQAAAATLDRALALAPERADLLTARAYLDLKGSEPARAKDGLEAALAQDPNQLAAYVALAHLAIVRGDRAEAEQHLAYAKRIDDTHPRLLLVEAQLAAIEGKDDRVLALLTAAAERAPKDPAVLAALGLAFLERRHFAFAVEALRKAMADEAAVPSLRGALLAALEAQGDAEAALAEAEAWAAQRPDSPVARWHRGRHRALHGQLAPALEDIEAVLARVPRHPQAAEMVLHLKGQLHGRDAVLKTLEAHTAADPEWSLPWRQWLSLLPAAEMGPVVQRWRAAAPNHPEALEAAALIAEAEGRGDEAVALADEALAREPRLQEARLLQGRIGACIEPAEAAVERLDALTAASVTPEQRRALAGWRGAALHRAGRVQEALEAWRQMWTEGPSFGLPLPRPEAADTASPAADGGAGFLLWGPAGSRVERVQAALIPALGPWLLLDRWNQPARDDGFNLLRVAPSDPRAGTAARWRGALEAYGIDPARVVDCLPSWDGWTQATLHGATLVAVMRDPRDLFLNWLAWGSSTGLTFPSPAIAAAFLHRLCEQLLAAEAAAPTQVKRIDADLLDSDPAAFGAQLTAVFGLESSPDVATAQALGRRPNGHPADFPGGTWRQYAEPLKALFEPLGEVAVRLGYPAE